MEPGEALALLDSMDKELLDSPAVTKEIIGDRPNTYTFTKVEHYRATLCGLAFLDLDFYWDKYVHVIILGACPNCTTTHKRFHIDLCFATQT